MTKKDRSHSPKSRELSEHEARLYRHDIWAKAVVRVVRAVVPWTGIAFCVYWAAQATIEWSGETTAADLHLILEGTGWAEIVAALGILFGFGGIAYGKQRKHLLRKTIRHSETLDISAASPSLNTPRWVQPYTSRRKRCYPAG